MDHPERTIAIEFPDGLFFADRSFERRSMPPPLVVAADPDSKPVASRDVIIDEKLDLWARIFLPIDAQGKLPPILYFHGGGFVCLAANFVEFHVLCANIAARSQAIVISVNYRLAPEHRLPAAYDDGYAALKWLAQNHGSDPWLAAHADLSRAFVMGDSAGANLAHNLTMRVASKEKDLDLGALRIAGRVLIQPFFGGVERVPSELRPKSPTAPITTDLCDRFWELALPLGSGRDHPYCCLAADVPRLAGQIRELPLPKTLVVAGGEDVLLDRVTGFVDLLRDAGKDPELMILDRADHAFYIVDGSTDTTTLLNKLSSFVASVLF